MNLNGMGVGCGNTGDQTQSMGGVREDFLEEGAFELDSKGE